MLKYYLAIPLLLIALSFFIGALFLLTKKPPPLNKGAKKSALDFIMLFIITPATLLMIWVVFDGALNEPHCKSFNKDTYIDKQNRFTGWMSNFSEVTAHSGYSSYYIKHTDLIRDFFYYRYANKLQSICSGDKQNFKKFMTEKRSNFKKRINDAIITKNALRQNDVNNKYSDTTKLYLKSIEELSIELQSIFNAPQYRTSNTLLENSEGEARLDLNGRPRFYLPRFFKIKKEYRKILGLPDNARFIFSMSNVFLNNAINDKATKKASTERIYFGASWIISNVPQKICHQINQDLLGIVTLPTAFHLNMHRIDFPVNQENFSIMPSTSMCVEYKKNKNYLISFLFSNDSMPLDRYRNTMDQYSYSNVK